MSDELSLPALLVELKGMHTDITNDLVASQRTAKAMTKVRNCLTQALHIVRNARSAGRDGDEGKCRLYYREALDSIRGARKYLGYAWKDFAKSQPPGVEAKDLAMRDPAETASVVSAKSGTKLKLLDNTKPKSGEESYGDLFREMKRTVGPKEILESLDGEQIKKVFRLLLEDAATETSAMKRASIIRQVTELFKYTEPKVVVDTGLDVEDMSEEEAMRLLQMAMNQ